MSHGYLRQARWMLSQSAVVEFAYEQRIFDCSFLSQQSHLIEKLQETIKKPFPKGNNGYFNYFQFRSPMLKNVRKWHCDTSGSIKLSKYVGIHESDKKSRHFPLPIWGRHPAMCLLSTLTGRELLKTSEKCSRRKTTVLLTTCGFGRPHWKWPEMGRELSRKREFDA